ncbi:transmembrane channel-like protein 6 isoform X2 [Ambystoma mexicanum]
MSKPRPIILNIPEVGSDLIMDLSPDEESALHDSFSYLMREHDFEELEMEHIPAGDGGEERHQDVSVLGELNESTDYSSATLRILASMPSRTIGRSRGAVISEYYNRTMQLRRRKSRPSIRDGGRSARPSIRHYNLEIDPDLEEEAEKRSLLVMELQSLSAGQRDRMLQSMPLSLAVKRELRQVQIDGKKKRGRVSCCSRIKYDIIMGARSAWIGILSFAHSMMPWHYALKQISGRFGSSVLSYFLFLKTLLLFSIFLFLICLVFIIVPQAVHPPVTPNTRGFTGLELLTGAGYFTSSLMYYGYYSNLTLSEACIQGPNGTQCVTDHRLIYNMPLAYVFTIGVSFFITCIILVYSMSRSFGESYRLGGTSGDHAIKVFCSWDYKVIKKPCVRVQHENIRIQLKELLCDRLQNPQLTGPRHKLQRMGIHILVWTLCLGSVMGSAIAVFYLSEYLHKDYTVRERRSTDLQREALFLPLPLSVCFLNLLLPYLYNLLALWENLESPGLEVYIAICRNLILKMVILGVLCFHWLGRKVIYLENKCWETFVGQELYRFVVMDFIFTLLDTFFGDLVLRLILEKRLKKKRRPEFDIARNVLELIYGQTLAWLGVLFSPLLPAVQTLKLLLLFYIKKTSLMMNCQAPSKPWQASHMTTIFITLLCFPSFLGAVVFISYTIWLVKPSDTCGPFQTLPTIYETGKIWIRQLEKSNPKFTWFTWIHRYLVENTFFIFLASGVLL